MRSGITLPFYVLLLSCVLESDNRSTISDVQKSHIRNVGRCCFRSSAMLNTLFLAREKRVQQTNRGAWHAMMLHHTRRRGRSGEWP
jgi:hypothetical protein